MLKSQSVDAMNPLFELFLQVLRRRIVVIKGRVGGTFRIMATPEADIVSPLPSRRDMTQVIHFGVGKTKFLFHDLNEKAARPMARFTLNPYHIRGLLQTLEPSRAAIAGGVASQALPLPRIVFSRIQTRLSLGLRAHIGLQNIESPSHVGV